MQDNVQVGVQVKTIDSSGPLTWDERVEFNVQFFGSFRIVDQIDEGQFMMDVADGLWHENGSLEMTVVASNGKEYEIEYETP